MNIIKAEEAGYCNGVTRAVSTVDNLIKEGDGREITILGELSHNKQEMQRLYSAGVKRVDTVAEAEPGYLIIRTHGVALEEMEEAKERGLTVIDCTCPFVKALQRKVQKYDELGYQIIIVGDKNHPEVQGACGWARKAPIVLNDISQTDSIEGYDKLCVVAQTTLIEEKFDKIVEALRQKSRDILVFNTICHATARRQQAAAELAECVDGMIVVGGYHSSNTQKLKEVCEAHCKNTWHIETAEELDKDALIGLETIGVTAGASTPGWIIEEVTETMGEIMFDEEKVVTEEELNQEPESVEETVEEETEASPVEETVTEEVTEEAQEEAEPEASEEEEVVQRTPEENSALDEEIDFAAEIENIKPIRKGQNVEGEVIQVSDDEVILNIGYKSDAVIHKRDFTWKHEENLADLVKPGDKVTATVVEYNDGDGRVKLSKTRYDSRLVQQRLKKAYDSKEVLYGTITKVSKDGKGLMVDVGFAEIFMPASQYNRYVKNLESLVGKDVRGVIIDLNFDRNRRRAIFSQRRLSEERREQLQKLREKRFEEILVGDVITGTVKTIKDFGIFVDLDGIDGFIHRSDLTWDRDNDPFKVVKEGDTIEAKVISRSRSSNAPKPKEPEQQEVVAEAVEGEAAEAPAPAPADNRRQSRSRRDDMKIKLSMKDLQEKPWDKFMKRYVINDQIDVEITNTMPFGAFAKILPGVEGLIHISEISYERVEKVSDVLSPGQHVEVKIINIDEPNNRISLSMKALQEKPANYVPRERDWSDRRGENRGGRRNNDRRNNRRNSGDRPPRRNNNSRNNEPTFYNDSEQPSLGTIGDSIGNVLEALNFDSVPNESTVQETVVETPKTVDVATEETVDTTGEE